jgi:hypothetical protein
LLLLLLLLLLCCAVLCCAVCVPLGACVLSDFASVPLPLSYTRTQTYNSLSLSLLARARLGFLPCSRVTSARVSLCAFGSRWGVVRKLWHYCPP